MRARPAKPYDYSASQLLVIICISLAAGCIFQQAYGWLTFGCLILLVCWRSR